MCEGSTFTGNTRSGSRSHSPSMATRVRRRRHAGSRRKSRHATSPARPLSATPPNDHVPGGITAATSPSGSRSSIRLPASTTAGVTPLLAVEVEEIVDDVDAASDAEDHSFLQASGIRIQFQADIRRPAFREVARQLTTARAPRTGGPAGRKRDRPSTTQVDFGRRRIDGVVRRVQDSRASRPWVRALPVLVDGDPLSMFAPVRRPVAGGGSGAGTPSPPPLSDRLSRSSSSSRCAARSARCQQPPARPGSRTIPPAGNYVDSFGAATDPGSSGVALKPSACSANHRRDRSARSGRDRTRASRRRNCGEEPGDDRHRDHRDADLTKPRQRP